MARRRCNHGVRPTSANTATISSVRRATTKPRSRSCALPALWHRRFPKAEPATQAESHMPAYRLHYFPESGNSYKLALMLTLCGQSFEPLWTDFGGRVTRTPAWRRGVNAIGEIPVLEVGPEKLTQTAPILLMLAERYGRFG